MHTFSAILPNILRSPLFLSISYLFHESREAKLMVVAIKLETQLPSQNFSAGLFNRLCIKPCDEIILTTSNPSNHIGEFCFSSSVGIALW